MYGASRILMLSVILFLIFCYGLDRRVNAAQQAVVVSGMAISGAARLKPGVYHLSDPGSGVVRISGSGFEVDCGGARLVGPGKGEGTGILISDARNVTIRNADVSGYRWGIVVQRCT